MKRIALYVLFLIVLAVGVSANPLLNVIADQTVDEGAVLTFTITCSAPDNGASTFATDAGFGTLTKVSDTAATYTWSPGFSDAGVYNVTFNVTDGNSTDAQWMLITVNDVVTTSVTLPNVNIGSNSQEREETVTNTFTVTNAGSNTVTGITITSTADSKYNVTFLNVPSSLAPGASQVVTVMAYIPEDQDSGSEKIGIVTFAGTASAQPYTQTSDLNMNAVSELEIRDVEVSRNSDGDDDKSLDDGDDYDDAKRGDTINFLVEVKNTFSDNIDMDDVTVTIYNDDLDWDEEEDTSSIKDGKKEEIELSADIDEDIDPDSYLVEITVEGEDENGAIHRDSWTIDIEIKQKNHEITIVDADLAPETISCANRRTKLSVDLWNSGKKDEDEVSVKVKADDLDFYKRDVNLEIDEDDDETKIYDISIPSNVGQGTYLVEVTVYYDNDDESDSKSLTLVVPNCGQTTPPDTGDDDDDDDTGDDDDGDDTIITPGDPQTGTGTTTTPPSQYYQVAVGDKGSESLFNAGSMTLILLGLGILLILIIIIILVAKFLV